MATMNDREPTTHTREIRPELGRDARLVEMFRVALMGLAAFTCAGAAVELAMLRHWKDGDQLIPWAVLAVVAVATLVLARSRSARVVLAVRLIAIGSTLGAAFGVLEHVKSNWETAPLSAAYAVTWDTLPWTRQWWLASTGGVGAAPPLAPGFLALSGVCLALATLGLAARWRRR